MRFGYERIGFGITDLAVKISFVRELGGEHFDCRCHIMSGKVVGRNNICFEKLRDSLCKCERSVCSSFYSVSYLVPFI